MQHTRNNRRGYVGAVLLLALLVFGAAACGGAAVAPSAAATTAATALPTPEGTIEPSTTVARDPDGTLAAVRARGTLRCGVSGDLVGFSFEEADGTYTGFDADFCRAVAAAVLGDPAAVDFVPLETQDRFAALRDGQVDVLFRNTTYTLTRDRSEVLDFAPITFYDGQGIMVDRALNVSSLTELEGTTICVQSDTTTELNLLDRFREFAIAFEPLVFDSIAATHAAYAAAECDAVTSDRSQLVALRSTLDNPAEHDILDAVLSKEPLAPAVAQGDPQWRDVISWVVYATIAAEELGITSENIEDALESDNPDIRRLLGQEGDLGEQLGLANDFALVLLRDVGNYGEIYNRNLGPTTPLNLERGPNATWLDGGLLYAPPLR